MSEELDMDILEESGKDVLLDLSKGVVGTIPLIGPIVSELYGSILPKQRIDRLTEFLKILANKFEEMEISMVELKKKLQDDYLVADFFDEVCLQAAKSNSLERREYLSNILINGLNEKEVIETQSLVLLDLIEQLNDIEIIILYSYTDKSREDKEFKENNSELLIEPDIHIGSSQEEINTGAIYQSYKNKLSRLDLLENGNNYDLVISSLGKLVLRHIGLLKDDEY